MLVGESDTTKTQKSATCLVGGEGGLPREAVVDGHQQEDLGRDGLWCVVCGVSCLV